MVGDDIGHDIYSQIVFFDFEKPLKYVVFWIWKQLLLRGGLHGS